MKLINIGYGNYVSSERLLAVVSPDSAPIKRIVQDSREIGMLIDATYRAEKRRPSSSWIPATPCSRRCRRMRCRPVLRPQIRKPEEI